MNISDLLDVDKVRDIEKKALKLAADNKLGKYERKKKLDDTNSRAVHVRMGKGFWKDHFKWDKKFKKIQKSSKKKINREYKNRCPKRYEIYIKSHWWEERKNKYYQAHGRLCAICGGSKYIQLHHIYYGGYGNEPDEQLIPFCNYHHGKFHKKYGASTSNFRKQTEEFIIEEQQEGEFREIVRNL